MDIKIINMNQNEVIEKIISEPKFYIGKMPQSTASNFVTSFRKGMAKQSTIDNFLQLFGYVKIQEAQYVLKVEGKPSNLKTK